MLYVHKHRDIYVWENTMSHSKDRRQSFTMNERTRVKRSFGSKEKFVPVIVETQQLDPTRLSSQKVKLMVSSCMPASQLIDIIRAERKLPSYKSCGLMINGKRLPSTMHIGKIHNEYKNENGLLFTTIVSENTFGCLMPPIEPITAEFESLDGLLNPDDPDYVPPNPQVIHLTATVTNPNMGMPTGTNLLEGSLPPVPPMGEGLALIPQGHLQGIVNSIADAIVTAVSSPPIQSVILQSFPNTEITLSPQLVKDALLSYMQSHSLTPSFDMDNFHTTIKITTSPFEDE